MGGDLTIEITLPGQPECLLIVDGYAVPHITLIQANENEFTICIGSVASKLVHRDDIEEWGWFLANAMAVAAGYTSHGKDSRKANPYNVQSMNVDGTSSNDDEQ